PRTSSSVPLATLSTADTCVPSGCVAPPGEPRLILRVGTMVLAVVISVAPLLIVSGPLALPRLVSAAMLTVPSLMVVPPVEPYELAPESSRVPVPFLISPPAEPPPIAPVKLKVLDDSVSTVIELWRRLIPPENVEVEPVRDLIWGS